MRLSIILKKSISAFNWMVKIHNSSTFLGCLKNNMMMNEEKNLGKNPNKNPLHRIRFVTMIYDKIDGWMKG